VCSSDLRDKWQKEWFLHHDNAPSHTSLVLQQFLAEKTIPVITQPPHSPDLAPSDFWLFPTSVICQVRELTLTPDNMQTSTDIL
jgi:hypothetical protein